MRFIDTFNCRNSWLIVWFMVLAGMPSAPAANAGAVTVTVVLQHGSNGYTGVSDTTLDAFAPTAVNGFKPGIDIRWLNGGTTQNAAALLQFNLSGIPADATIDTASLALYCIHANNASAADSLLLSRVMSAWNANSTFASGVPRFVNSGVTPPSLGAAYPDALATPTLYTIPGLESLVQGWVSAPETNHGILLSCASDIEFTLASAVHPTQSARPALQVTYTTAGPAAPVITTQPANQTAAEGSTATFTVAAVGTGPLAFTWQRNGVTVPGGGFASFTTSLLTLSEDGDAYRVMVSNSMGVVWSQPAWLTVTPTQHPPIITIQPIDQTTIPGAAPTFRVTVSGDAPFAYQWRRNGGNLLNETQPTFTPSVSLGMVDGDLVDVIITNAAGSTISNTAVLHIVPPGSNPITASLASLTFGPKGPYEVVIELANSSGTGIRVFMLEGSGRITLPDSVYVTAGGTISFIVTGHPKTVSSPTGFSLILHNESGLDQTIPVTLFPAGQKKKACAIGGDPKEMGLTWLGAVAMMLGLCRLARCRTLARRQLRRN